MTRSAKWRLVKALPFMAAVAGAVMSARRRRAATATGPTLQEPIPPMTPVSAAPPAPLASATAAPTEVVVAAVELVVPVGADENGAPVADESVAPATSEPASGPSGGATTSNQILEALAASGPMSPAEIAEATGIGRATVRSALSRLTRAGRLVKGERGYVVAGDASSPAPTAGSAPRPRRGTSKARSASTKAGGATTKARGATTKDKVLSALSSETGMTAGEVAAATGVARGTVSTTLSNLVKSGEIVKAPRGYRLRG